MLAAVLLLASSIVATDFLSCMNLSSPVDLRVSGCKQSPCNFTTGGQVSAQVTFKVDHEIKTLSPRLTEKVLDDDNDIPLLQTDGCKSLVQASCPIEDGETVTYQLRFNIPDINIKSPVVFNFSMLDQNFECVTHFSISGNIV